MNDQAVFYALSTLAQTCAALAAFVGAVGVYRLQSLKDKRRGLLQSIYARRGNPTEAPDTVVADAAKAQKDHQLQDLLTRYGRVAPTIRRNVCALCVFEAWNLFVILISLAGFAHTHRLIGSWWTPRVLWCIAVITVIVTGYGVVVWLRSDD